MLAYMPTLHTYMYSDVRTLKHPGHTMPRISISVSVSVVLIICTHTGMFTVQRMILSSQCFIFTSPGGKSHCGFYCHSQGKKRTDIDILLWHY